jgi:hypothetical protein
MVRLPTISMYELGPSAPSPFAQAPMTFGPAVAVDAEGLAWARPDRFEVVLFDASGVAYRIFRIDQQLDLVTSEIWSSYLEETPPAPGEPELPQPNQVPSFDRVFFASDETVWARRYDWTDDGEEWIRFAANGAAQRFGFPARVSIHTASAERAYGVMLDDLDVESVVAFELE